MDQLAPTSRTSASEVAAGAQPSPEKVFAEEEEAAPQDLIEDELLIEEITIDGICGVY